jgi:hypothetical protein
MASTPRSEIQHGNSRADSRAAGHLAAARAHATLPNGLEVVLVESHTIPKFTGQLFFRSGNAVTAASAAGFGGHDRDGGAHGH